MYLPYSVDGVETYRGLLTTWDHANATLYTSLLLLWFHQSTSECFRMNDDKGLVRRLINHLSLKIIRHWYERNELDLLRFRYRSLIRLTLWI